MITFTNVSKRFHGARNFSVRNVSLQIPQGKTLVLLGSSGCGKTTCLKMINRLIKPSSGTIHIAGQDLQNFDAIKLRRTMGYAFQGVGLFPHLTVAKNISIVLRLEGKSEQEQTQRAQALLSFVNLDPNIYRDRYPSELSGGEQQRVGVARALANEPDYLLMDEPFGALDAITRDNLQQDFLKLKQNIKATVVFVTHDVIEALRLADVIAVMDRGEIVQIGDQHDILNNPANDFVKNLFAKPVAQYAQWMEI
jgi:osmoprotectant transport system ATP-binding protein